MKAIENSQATFPSYMTFIIILSILNHLRKLTEIPLVQYYHSFQIIISVSFHHETLAWPRF